MSTDRNEESHDPIRLGVFLGFELLQQYIPEAAASNRAVVFVHAKLKNDSSVSFAQMTTVRSALVQDWSEKSIERLLTFDAMKRAKRRILARSFKKGRIYTAELTASDLDKAD